MSFRLGFLTVFLVPFLLSAQHWATVKTDKDANFFEKQQAFNDYWEGREYEKGKGYKQFKRWEWFWEQRVGPNGEFPAPNHLWREYESFQIETKSKGLAKNNANWTQVGPSQLSFSSSSPGIGRVMCVAEDPNNANIVYAGTPAGGLWKSFDGGSSWQPLTDHLPTMGVSGVVVDPVDTDIIYIATGDGDGNDTYSVGVLKSYDGGVTWETTGLDWAIPYMRVSHKLLMSPVDNNVLLVATDEGIWKTENAGESWISVHNGDIEDMEYHPTDPSIVYANGNAFYRSTDGGDSFESVINGLPSNSDVSRYSTAVSEDEPDWVYLLAGDSDTQGYLGLWRSTDQGQTFELRSSSPNIMGWSTDGGDSGGQAWYDIAIEVDPDNASRVFVGGVNLWRSNNGGSTWSIRAHWVYPSSTGTYVHADIHALSYVGNRLYCMSDGGIFKSSNDGSSFTDITSGIANSQFYRIGPSASDASLILAGAQDNGTISKEGNSWGQVYGGDGMNCLYHPTNSDRYWVATQYGNIARTNNGGNSFTSWSQGIPETGAWVTPYMLDPNNSNIMYAGYEHLWKRTGNGSWQMASGGGGNISQFNIAPSNSDVIYLVRGNTSLSMTDDGGDNWTNLSLGFGGETKTSIAFNPQNENEVYVTLSGFNNGSKVFKTSNGGQSWENISSNLPNFPANSIVYENGSNGGLYVGMDVGIYYINNDLANWIPFDDGLPRVPISELEIHYGTNKMRAATYGRGVWEGDLFTGLTLAPEADFVADKIVACVGDEVTFTDFSLNHAPQWDWAFEGANVSSSDVQNPTVTYSSEGAYDVSLTVQNSAGVATETKAEFITIMSEIGESLPFIEGFESFAALNESDRWVTDNEDNDIITWEVNQSNGAGTPTSVWLNNYNNSDNYRDRLISGTIDLGSIEAVDLTFDVAFAQKNEDNRDKLRIYVSTDCGEDWSLKKSFSGHTTLKSVEPREEEFFPTDNEWHNLLVNNISGSNLVEGFRFQFYFENDGGNNIFIDNINLISPTVGLEDLDRRNLNLELYPNPTDDISTLNFQLIGDRDVMLQVMDISGRIVHTDDLGSMSFGEHSLQLDSSPWSSGIYTVRLTIENTSSQVKWVVN